MRDETGEDAVHSRYYDGEKRKTMNERGGGGIKARKGRGAVLAKPK